MSRMIGYVPVRVGQSVVPVTVEAEVGCQTHFDMNEGSARIVVAEDLSPDVATREVEACLPEVERMLSRRLLN